MIEPRRGGREILQGMPMRCDRSSSLHCRTLLAKAVLLAAALCAAQPGMVAQQSAPDASAKLPTLTTSLRGAATQAAGLRSRNRFALTRSDAGAATARRLALAQAERMRAQATSTTSAAWTPLGPMAISNANYGLVSGRISALAVDPNDATGATLWVGTTGGGLWRSQNASAVMPSGTKDSSAYVSLYPITDNLSVISSAVDASISIGAVSVQPTNSNVILAGTGDTNDHLDSYYGAGILRSADGGSTWSLIYADGDGYLSFDGNGFAGFAWGTSTLANTVVAAVGEAYDGYLMNAYPKSATSVQGLYYSSDAGATWHLATLMDGSSVVLSQAHQVLGISATSVVWNPVRKLFFAAIRYHGYYTSADGITWTRMADASQPGALLPTTACPVTASTACPIFRGALAVNPETGNTYAWTVNYSNQDLGVWEFACNGSCASTTPSFSVHWDTTALETDDANYGSATIEDGNYNLTLAAIPYNGGELVVAGAHDLWAASSPMSLGGAWRNVTNSTTGFCAKVGEFQHAQTWMKNTNGDVYYYLGNDAGLWRSLDELAVDTSGACMASDATHFQNLNGSFGQYSNGAMQYGSITEASSLASLGDSLYTLFAGFAVLGSAGTKSTTGVTRNWSQTLSGDGGVVLIDSTNRSNWYVNNAAGVSIYGCSSSSLCTAADFGTVPLVSESDVDGDGADLPAPATFLIDPLDSSKFLLATCRIWRGSTSGGWSSSNVISGILDGRSGSGPCSGDAAIRSLAAMKLTSTTEVIYAGGYGVLVTSNALAGHIYRAVFDSTSSTDPTWVDLTGNLVSNGAYSFNYHQHDISSIVIDATDATGNTIYASVAGVTRYLEPVTTLYRSTDGGSTWAGVSSNLPYSPVNAVLVDPRDAATVYVATDMGVYSTRHITTCATSSCWTAYGSGLPMAPAVALMASPLTSTTRNLVAATYGRGLWTAPLWSSGTLTTTATLSATSLSFGSQSYGSTSSAKTITLKNTGTASLLITTLAITGNTADFVESDSCLNQTVNAGSSCTIQVKFSPTALGTRAATITLSGNIASSLTIALAGTGSASNVLTLSPGTINFGSVNLNVTSDPMALSVANISALPVRFTSVTAVAPFAVKSTTCSGTVAASTTCQVLLTFTPTTGGVVSNKVTLVDSIGTQTATLTGTGLTAATDKITPTTLTFPKTGLGLTSSELDVTMSNTGGQTLSSIKTSFSKNSDGTSDFALGTNTKACSTILAAASTCVFPVVFTPTQLGTRTGTLTISDALKTQTVALNGTSVAAPAFSFLPTAVSFSNIIVGKAATPVTVTLTNPGALPLAGLSVSLANLSTSCVGASANCLTISASTCTTGLAAGASCTMQVNFTPLVAGASSATLQATSTTAGVKTVSIPINGSAYSQTSLSVAPTSLVFDTTLPGGSSAAKTVTITNNGKAPAASLKLVASSPFGITGDGCTGKTLAAAASCTVQVYFAPTVALGFTGTLTVTSSTASNSGSVKLSGLGGTPGAIDASVSEIDFAQTDVAATSETSLVTFTNPSTGTALSGLTFAISPATEFKIVSNTCGTTLGAGKSCTVGVAFAPLEAGIITGSLTVGSSLLSSAATVVLTGTGFNFSFANNTTSQTVINGGTATYQLVIQPMANTAGVFTLSCSSLPPYSTCTLNPSNTIPVSAGVTGNPSVLITTGVKSGTTTSENHRSRPALLLLCGGMLLFPIAIWRGRRLLLLLALLMVIPAGISSCAASSGGSGTVITGDGYTPAGSYSITVTATSGSISKTATLSLVVD